MLEWEVVLHEESALIVEDNAVNFPEDREVKGVHGSDQVTVHESQPSFKDVRSGHLTAEVGLEQNHVAWKIVLPGRQREYQHVILTASP